jgi:hypothetical protein
MNKTQALAVALLWSAVGPASAQSGVGVSISVHQPGVYGRINIGDVPPPALVLPRPVIYAPPPVVVQRAPIYLYVPPGHQQNWGRYCGRYGACGQPVYFVRDEWVRERYEHAHPGWERGRHGGWDDDDDRGHGKGKYKYKEKGHGRGHDRD